MIHKRSTELEQSVKIFYWRALTGFTAVTYKIIFCSTLLIRRVAKTITGRNVQQKLWPQCVLNGKEVEVYTKRGGS